MPAGSGWICQDGSGAVKHHFLSIFSGFAFREISRAVGKLGYPFAGRSCSALLDVARPHTLAHMCVYATYMTAALLTTWWLLDALGPSAQ